MSNTEKLNKLQEVLNGYTTPTVKRASFISAVATVGLVEKDTYVVLREWTKDSQRGHYVVAAMLREIETKLTGKILTKPVKRKTRESSEEPVLAYGEIAYTDADIADELSLMGTTI
jgi:hypothetical protein